MGTYEASVPGTANGITTLKAVSFQGVNFTGHILANIYIPILSSQPSTNIYTKPTTSVKALR